MSAGATAVTAPGTAPTAERPPLAAQWRPALAIGGVATALAIAIAWAGTRAAQPGVPAWPRFWAATYFVLLLWPLGLSLLGRIAGARVEAVAAAILLVATAGQQFGRGAVPLPVMNQWYATLAAPGDAVRQRILLPAAGDPTWQGAWARATRAAVVVCTAEAARPEANVTLSMGESAAVPLDTLERRGNPGTSSWYVWPASRSAVEQALDGGRRLSVVVRRGAADGPPVRICGGRDDPTRPGAGGSERWLDGRWLAGSLADAPMPLVEGRPAPGRYYVELRLYDAQGFPAAGIWY